MMIGCLFCIGGAAMIIYVIEKLSRDEKDRRDKKDSE